MHITVRLPNELGEEGKQRTGSATAYVTEALTEKLEQERRRAARERI